MFSEIPTKNQIDRIRENLKHMFGEEYNENIKETVSHITNFCKEHNLDIEEYISDFIKEVKNNQVTKLLHIDAFMYLQPEKIYNDSNLNI